MFRWIIGTGIALASGGVTVALYNWLVEPIIPDVVLIGVSRKVKGEGGEDVMVKVPYLMLDDVGRLAATLLVALPLAAGTAHLLKQPTPSIVKV